jgi:hypothetical protein
MPKRSAATSVHVSGAAEPVKRPPRHLPRIPMPSLPHRDGPRVPATRAVRRRRTLLGLVGTTVLLILLAVAGVVAWPLQLVPELLLVGFVAHLRTQARQAAAVSRQRRRGAVAQRPAAAAGSARRPTPQRPVTQRPAPRPAPAAEMPLVAEMPPATEVEPALVMATAVPEAAYDVAADAAFEAAAHDDAATSTWEPRPVPPPTYSLKPPAPARRVVFDSAAEVSLADPHAGEDILDQILERDYELGIEHRRAVND